MIDHSDVVSSIVEILRGLSGDWEFDKPIGSETRLLGDLAMKSLDLVVLSNALVKRYGLIPFDLLYTQMGEIPVEQRDMTVSEFADFVVENSPTVANTKQSTGAA